MPEKNIEKTAEENPLSPRECLRINQFVTNLIASVNILHHVELTEVSIKVHVYILAYKDCI